MKRRPLLISACVLAAVGVSMRLALSAYTAMAYVLMFAAAMCLTFYFLRPRKLRRVLAALLCVGVLYFAAVEAVIISVSRGEDGDAEYLIVLGAGVDGTVPSASLRWRLEAALDYLGAHPDAVAVVSGGQGRFEAISEAECMYRWLTARGVEPARVICEDRASSTAENLAFSLALIGEGRSIAIVSAEYHLCRALAMAKRLGLDAFGVAAKTELPVLRINYFIREAFAVTAFWVLG